MPKLLILLHHRFELWNAPAWLPQCLAADFPALQVVSLSDYSRAGPELAETEIFFGWSLRPQQFRAAPRLRWIHSPAAAVHQLMHPELVASEVVVTNARSVHGPVVAEHALALMFALARRLPSALRSQQRRTWGQQQLWDERPRPRELRDSTLLIIGMGSIGSELARLAAPLGMRVVAVREHPERAQAAQDAHAALQVFGPGDLDRLLPRADFVVLAAPLTERTRALLDARRLDLMRPHAYLVNVSRGPLTDEAALAAALRDRAIAGAALDVFSSEPLPPDSPFWALENCLITPHSAGLTEKLWDRHYQLMHENLTRYLSGRPLLCSVDKSKGY